MSVLALQARDVRVQRGQRTILQLSALDIPAGRWTSIVGPNGAGKSTLLQLLAGLLTPNAQDLAQVKLHGQDLATIPARQRAKQLAWMGQNQSSEDLRVVDVVMLGRLPHQAWLAGPSDLDRAKVQAALESTHAWDWRDRPLSQLSGGERQRVLLARMLAVDAQVMLMDEPLANLDPPHQADWLALVHDLVRSGKTVVSVLHEISMALQSDDLILMNQGQVTHQGSAQDPATHLALSMVFEHRIRVLNVEGWRVAVPVISSWGEGP
jgi:iron complex transport system ATP-binding protein